MLDRQAPAWAEQYIGIPFKELGRDRTGLDCWGLVHLVKAEQFHTEIPSYSGDYMDSNDRKEVAQLISGEITSRWSSVVTPLLGDIVLLRILSLPCHVGIVVARDNMLHLDYDVGATIEPWNGPKWGKRCLGFYRYNG